MSSILVVDDSDFMRASLCNMIKSQKLSSKILEARDGIEAVKKYKDEKPDLVTMDIDMPKANGVQALRAIKKIDPNAKVIVITGNHETLMHHVSKFGAVGYLTKPLDKMKATWAIMNSLN